MNYYKWGIICNPWTIIRISFSNFLTRISIGLTHSSFSALIFIISFYNNLLLLDLMRINKTGGLICGIGLIPAFKLERDVSFINYYLRISV